MWVEIGLRGRFREGDRFLRDWSPTPVAGTAIQAGRDDRVIVRTTGPGGYTLAVLCVDPRDKRWVLPTSTERTTAMPATAASGYDPHVRVKTLTYLSKHPNARVTVDEMMVALGLRRPQVQKAINDIIKLGLAHVEVVIGGNVWVYRGDKPPAAADPAAAAQEETPSARPNPRSSLARQLVVTVVADLPNGDRLVHDPDSRVYRLSELR